MRGSWGGGGDRDGGRPLLLERLAANRCRSSSRSRDDRGPRRDGSEIHLELRVQYLLHVAVTLKPLELFGYKCRSNIKDRVPLTAKVITTTYRLILALLWECEIKTLAPFIQRPISCIQLEPVKRICQ